MEILFIKSINTFQNVSSLQEFFKFKYLLRTLDIFLFFVLIEWLAVCVAYLEILINFSGSQQCFGDMTLHARDWCQATWWIDQRAKTWWHGMASPWSKQQYNSELEFHSRQSLRKFLITRSNICGLENPSQALIIIREWKGRQMSFRLSRYYFIS